LETVGDKSVRGGDEGDHDEGRIVEPAPRSLNRQGPILETATGQPPARADKKSPAALLTGARQVMHVITQPLRVLTPNSAMEGQPEPASSDHIRQVQGRAPPNPRLQERLPRGLDPGIGPDGRTSLPARRSDQGAISYALVAVVAPILVVAILMILSFDIRLALIKRK
jgi:hypothetical protein